MQSKPYAHVMWAWRSAWCIATFTYIGAAVVLTWPLATDFARRLPMGTESSATVARASAWALWWVADRLAAGGVGLWDAPIFFPTEGTFALSEPLLLQGLLVAPAFGFGASPIVAHNLALVGTLVGNGLAAFGLLGHLGGRGGRRLLGGLLVVALPFGLDQLGVLTLVSVAGPVATLWALLRCVQRPNGRRGFALGAALGATYLSCAQFGLFTALALAPALLWFSARRPKRGWWSALAVAGASLALLTGPVVAAQVEVRDRLQLERAPSRAAAHATRVSDWAQRSPAHRISWGISDGKRPLFPGLVVGGLAIAAGVGAPRLPRRRRRALGLCAAFGASAFLLATIPSTPLFDLLRAVPGVAQVRTFWRAGALTQLALALSAGVWLISQPPLGKGWRRQSVMAALLVLVALDLSPRRQRLARAPQPDQYAELAQVLDELLEKDEPLVFLPAPRGKRGPDYQHWAWWMVAQPQLRRPFVVGYSSYFPERPFGELRTALRRLPNGDWRAQLHALGVRYAVVEAAWWQRTMPAAPDVVVWSPPGRRHWLVRLQPPD
ncbi:MAG: hypothetical protein AAGA56_01010 [Myxococcota bacterium]